MLTKRTLREIQRKTKRHGTKARIARKTGIKLSYLSRILRGLQVPGEDKAALLQDELGIPASEFRRGL